MKRFLILLILVVLMFPSYCLSAEEEKKGKVLISYYSRTGNTEEACRVLQKELGADVVEIKDMNNRDSVFGMIGGMLKTLLGLNTRIEPEQVSLDNYDLIVLGSPVWASKLTPAISTFIKKNNFEGKKVVIFITSDSFIEEKYQEKQKSAVEKQGCDVAGHFQVQVLEDRNDEKVERAMEDVLEDVRNSAEKIKKLK